MFEKLMNLPLFQGISQTTLASLVEKYPFHFLKYRKGETIIEQGEVCSHLKFIISGRVLATMLNSHLKVEISQQIEAPEVITPDYLFGRTTAYPCKVVADTECGILQIPKAVYVKMIQHEEVLLFNILNYLSRNSQNRLWSFSSKSSGKFTTRLALMVYELTTKKSENIKISFKQKDLCMLLGIRRTSLFTALEELKQKQIIDYSQNEVIILNRRALIEIIHN
ncbi:MAG: Crp/Fnr family transcriptional regulator [Sodaliphilus sp.]